MRFETIQATVSQREHIFVRLRLFYWGFWAVMIGISLYFGAIILSILRLLLLQRDLFVSLIARILWVSGVPTTIGIIMIALDLAFCLSLSLNERVPGQPWRDTSAIQ